MKELNKHYDARHNGGGPRYLCPVDGCKKAKWENGVKESQWGNFQRHVKNQHKDFLGDIAKANPRDYLSAVPDR